MKRVNIFIPSAGLGERLRPITEHIPKPIIPIMGRPVLEITIERVSQLLINKICINLHHKMDVIKSWLDRSDFSKKVTIFEEDPILGTGGALKNAAGLLSEGIFLVHNSDILSDIDLEKVINFHLSSGNIGTLAVHNYHEFNNVAINEDGTLKGIGKTYSELSTLVAFTGIAVYSPQFLGFLPEGISSVVGGWQEATASGCRIGTIDVSGSYWKDIGTPYAYYSALTDALQKDGERIYIHPTAKVEEDAWLDGYVVLEEGCLLNKGISLRNAIIFPGAEIEENASHENCIIGPGYKIGIDSYISTDIDLVGSGGSDRKYYRIKRNKGSAILMESQKDDPDFERHINYTLFFQNHSIPVPKTIEVDRDIKKAVFEDLGDISLYSWLKLPRKAEEKEKIYKGVINILTSLHSTATRHLSECPLLHRRLFDYEHLRWETDYFMKRFVKEIRKITFKNITALEDEFHRLALEVDSFKKTVIHRDFQSQNIMITKGGIPQLVDYQGARVGPPAYDLASILWDPYHRLENTLRERLVDYYIRELKRIPDEKFIEVDFRKTLLPCRLQRHMQALGAYGFLSVIKGKKYFLKYVPEGLRLLKEDVNLSKNEYPELYKLVMAL